MREFLPFIISEGGDVEVDQLGTEPGELVVQADAVVSSTDNVTFFILGAGFPCIWMDNFHCRVSDGHPYGSIASFEYLIRNIQSCVCVDKLPVTVLLAGFHMDFVLHGNAWGRVQPVAGVKAGIC